MSGHSKWSKVKHQKAVTDVVKGRAFTKASRAITLAVREGGGIADPEKNFRLRLAVELARAVNMPKNTIDRAITKAVGEGGEVIESLVYEAYAPGGVAMLIASATDNRQRTVSQIKNIVEKAGGTLASPGAVNFLFSRAGVLTIPKEGMILDRVFEAALTSGAQDVREADDVFEVYTDAAKLHEVRTSLAGQGIESDNAQIIMKAKNPIDLAPAGRIKIDALVEQLEAAEDVQDVYTNLL